MPASIIDKALVVKRTIEIVHRELRLLLVELSLTARRLLEKHRGPDGTEKQHYSTLMSLTQRLGQCKQRMYAAHWWPNWPPIDDRKTKVGQLLPTLDDPPTGLDSMINGYA